MYFYIYRVTNTINGNIYVGKHKSEKHPLQNGYYGSGKLIKAAIAKYGKHNFAKEVLHWCNTLEEMATLEESIVTPEFVARIDTYNMHRGGKGGFDHINNVPPDDRANVKAYKEKYAAGLIKNGAQCWNATARAKVVEQARINRENGAGGDTWSVLSAEEKQKRSQKLSQAVSGENNSAYGTHLYIQADFVGNDFLSYTQRYKENEQPSGWITVTEWKDRQKRKSGAYGKSWFNDGINNVFMDPTDPRSAMLVRGRLGKVGQKKTA
jgi:hypothetical protein